MTKVSAEGRLWQAPHSGSTCSRSNSWNSHSTLLIWANADSQHAHTMMTCNTNHLIKIDGKVYHKVLFYCMREYFTFQRIALQAIDTITIFKKFATRTNRHNASLSLAESKARTVTGGTWQG